jgi:predicted secreted protein
MSIKSILRGIGVAIALSVAVAAPLSAADAPKPSSKWRVIFDHWADVDGELVLHIAPVEGAPIDVSIKVPKGTKENSAAELVAGALKGTLGGGYKVDVDDGEKVEIKAKGKTPKFVVSLASSTVTGLNVKVKRS